MTKDVRWLAVLIGGLRMAIHLPMGEVENLARNTQEISTVYSNGWVAQYAADVAARLLPQEKPLCHTVLAQLVDAITVYLDVGPCDEEHHPDDCPNDGDCVDCVLANAMTAAADLLRR